MSRRVTFYGALGIVGVIGGWLFATSVSAAPVPGFGGPGSQWQGHISPHVETLAILGITAVMLAILTDRNEH